MVTSMCTGSCRDTASSMGWRIANVCKTYQYFASDFFEFVFVGEALEFGAEGDEAGVLLLELALLAGVAVWAIDRTVLALSD